MHTAPEAHAMNERPRSVMVVGYLFIAAGVIGLVYHASELTARQLFDHDFLWIAVVRALAILSGVFILRGSNWARWLLLVWIAYHVILSIFHTLSELAVHGLVLAVVAYLLVRPPASAFFRGQGAEPA
jgi:hypothetical protein